QQQPIQQGYGQQQPIQQGYGQQQPIQQGYEQQQPIQQGYEQQQPIQQGYEQQPGQVPLAPASTYTMELLRKAASPLIDAGRSPELSSWIKQRGAEALTQLDKSHYGAFATYLRSLGAQI
ncbi:MAG: hypothetical protein WD469_08325, partial [Paenibacillaceae bacterium]